LCTHREGGGPIQEFYEEVFGVDLYANFFMSMCGIPIDPPRSEKPLKTFGFYFVNCPKTGTLLKNDFLEAAKQHPLVTSVECMLAAMAANGAKCFLRQSVGFEDGTR
jgi:hypothetical protein